MAHNIRMLAGQQGAERSVDPALSIAFSHDGAGALRMTYRSFSFAPLASSASPTCNVGIGVIRLE